ncbi:MAG: hypothetical protein R2911_27785 [Caldilineaceae bacterium]
MAVIITWPLVLHWQTQIPVGLGGDAWVHQWTFWWIKQALAQGKDIFYTNLLFIPMAFRSRHTTLPGSILPSGCRCRPSGATWGLWDHVSGHFYAQWLWHVLAAFGALCSMAASLIGGLVYGSWPYLVRQPGHPNMPIIMRLPLAILFMQRTLSRSGCAMRC